MDKILKKLRSRTGASITFALFLFLVCAVLCSVILAAATAASGRLAGIAQTDQRYYAVTSSCEMLRDVIGGNDNAVTIVKKKVTTTQTTYVDGEETGSTSGDPITTYTVGLGTETEPFTKDTTEVSNTDPVISVLMNAAISVYRKEKTLDGTISWPKTLNIASTDTMKSALGIDTTDSDPLAVTISASIDGISTSDSVSGDKRLTVSVFNTSDTDASDQFTEIMDFSLEKTIGGLPKEETAVSGTPTTTDDGVTNVVTTTTTTYETTTYSWTLNSIKTKMAIIQES